MRSGEEVKLGALKGAGKVHEEGQGYIRIKGNRCPQSSSERGEGKRRPFTVNPRSGRKVKVVISRKKS